MPRKMVKRCVPQPTAKVSNECLGRCVSDVFFYDSGTPIRSFQFNFPCKSMILDLENSGACNYFISGSVSGLGTPEIPK